MENLALFLFTFLQPYTEDFWLATQVIFSYVLTKWSYISIMGARRRFLLKSSLFFNPHKLLMHAMDYRYGQKCKMTSCQTSFFATQLSVSYELQKCRATLFKSLQFLKRNLVSIVVLKYLFLFTVLFLFNSIYSQL